jgi:hypothetical protein
MQPFLARFGSEIKGVLSGLDRVRFRGTIRWLANERGVGTYLSSQRIRLTEFKEWAKVRTQRRRLELRHGPAKCSHYYFYLRDPLYGPLSVRLQTWLPL